MEKEYIRIIPKLEVKGPNLVKGIKLDGLRVLGNPENFALHYFNEGADEIFFQDVVASLYQQNTLLSILKKVANNILIPITAGGGVKTLSDIQNFLNAGADRVSINSAIVSDFSFFKESIKKFGVSNIVVSVEAVKIKEKYMITIKSGREFTGIELNDWIKKINSVAPVEIFLTSVDMDGTGRGYDINMVSYLRNVKNSIVLVGGASNLREIAEIIKKNKYINGIGIGSALHYDTISHKKLKFDDTGNTEFLKHNIHKPKNLVTFSLKKIKSYLKQKKINIRN